MKKRDISILTLGPSASMLDAVKAISANGVRGVFICDEGELLGMVMDADIRRQILKNADLSGSVRPIMKTSPVTVSAGLSPKEREHAAVQSGKILVPVVDQDNRLKDYVYTPEIMVFDPARNGHGAAHERGVYPPSKVLVIGGAGYIGSELVTKLLRMGHEVRCLDLLLYDKAPITFINGDPHFHFTRGDCRNTELLSQVMEGVDAVVHLGEIVGDPACKINEDFTIDTNFMATSKIVDLCVKHQVPRLVFTSSCSVYGCNDQVVDEESELNPVSLYARCKIECERAIRQSAGSGLCATILRLGTVHGLSLRQRFDLVVNLLAIKGLVDGKFQVFGGNQWRPFLSVQDVCKGIVSVLHAERRLVAGQTFNLGDSRHNHTITEVGELVTQLIPEAAMEVTGDLDDPRNYRVSFDKIQGTLGFTCESTVADTIRALALAHRQEGRFADYGDPKYHNVLTLK